MVSFCKCAPLGLAVLAAGVVIPGPAVHGEVAIQVDFGAPDTIFPNTGTTHGWQFTVNAPIEVTHLGLYDRFQDGFALEHPIGLWNEAGTLLAQETIGPGGGDLLIDNFQYVAIEDITAGAVVLTPGTAYTVGFFTAVFVQSDGMVIFDGFHTVNPVINYVGFGVSDFTNGLEMPIDPDFGFHRWGPNLLFDVVPVPSALPLLAGGLLLAPRRRRAMAGGPSATRAWRPPARFLLV